MWLKAKSQNRLRGIFEELRNMFDRIRSYLGWESLSDEQFEHQREDLLKKIPVPVFWLFGKTGSGKSSIVRYLTGSTQAEIGNGFQPKTKTSFAYDFPSSTPTLIRFLDTRGLGEQGYDPHDDLASFDQSTHVVIVVVRVMDHALAEVIEPLRKIRAARPKRPILLALTCLHEAYPFEQHPNPDPFEIRKSASEPTAGDTADPAVPDGERTAVEPIPTASSQAQHPELQRSLRAQELRFAGLVDRIVPIDLTNPNEGFYEPNFGGKRLHEALIALLPAAYQQSLIHLDDVRDSSRSQVDKKGLTAILTYSSLAAASAASPLPWIDIPLVMALQTRLVYVLADLYEQKMNAALLAKMAGAVGGRLAVRFAIRAPLKMIPFAGHAANAAMAFAYTFSLGKACCWYFGQMQQGNTPTTEEWNQVWSEQMQQAVDAWKNRTQSSR